MKAYLDLLSHVLENGEGHDDRTGVGTRSVFGYQFRHSLSEGFPLLTTKKLPFRWIAEELFWFLSGSTNEKDLRERGVDIWAEWATAEQCARFSRKEGDLGHVYGGLWRNFLNRHFPHEPAGHGNDQIAALMHDIQSSPNSRRLIVSGWHPIEQRSVALPPCHTLWQVKCHEDGRLSLHLYARSIDSFLGLPFNIASYALLAHLLAWTTNHTPGDLIISFGDLHIYNNHVAQVREQLSREPRELPFLYINERLKGHGLAGLLDCKWGDLRLHRYDPHPSIKAEVAV